MGKNSTKKRKAARQDQWIGYAVLGFGVLAVLAVGALAVSRYAPQTAISSATEQAAPKKGPARKLTEAKVEGDWETSFRDYNCILQLHDGTYQILAIRTVPGVARYYSRGTYTLDGPFITLIPDKAMGSPASDDPAHKYRRLAHRPFTIELRLKGDRQIWFPGPIDENFPNRDHIYPLVQYSGGDSLIWTRKE